MDKIEFENGKAPYLSAENLNQMQSNIENAINDSVSGETWRTLSLESDVTPTSSGYGGTKGIKYKKIGNHVFVKGSVSVTWSGSGAKRLGTLPTGYRPKFVNYSLNTLAANRYARINVATNGSLNIDFIREFKDGSNYIEQVDWIDVSIDFWTDLD